jgi:ornithine decarboxylase
MSILHNKIKEWRTELPMVKPFYAIKCNPNEEILKTMLNEGLGFDVASKSEIDKMLRLGAKQDHLIYAHPVKSISDINYANKQNIKLTTFDSLSELKKLSSVSFNEMNCLLRLKVDNPTAKIQLGLKYGAEKNEYKLLIDTAKDLNINIVGTSIHVGSASKDPFVFANGINYCREVFDYATKRGFLPNILDIGGGFSKDTFKDCAAVIRNSIKENKFDGKDMQIISEPGRHLVEEVFDFYTPVVGIRTRNNRDEYYIGETKCTGDYTDWKPTTKIEDVHFAQAINYLEAYNLEVGLLINFGERSLNFNRLKNKKFKIQ